MAKKKQQVFDLEFFRKHGKRGGLIGGKMATENMTPEQLRERALKAVANRKWHPVLTEEEKKKRAAEAAKTKRPVGRPRKNPIPEAVEKRPRKVKSN